MKEPPYTPLLDEERSSVYCKNKCHYVDPADPSWHPCELECLILRVERLRET